MIRIDAGLVINSWRYAIAINLCALVFCSTPVSAQDAVLEWFPIRPVSFDVVFRQQTFAPNDREVTIQAGITALRYGDLEVRGLYRHFSYHTQDFKTDQNALL